MKNLLVLSVLLVFFYGCNQSTEKTKEEKFIILSGKIENSKTNFITLKFKIRTDTAFLDTNGYFKEKFKINMPDYYTFRHGNEFATLFLIPDDSIYLTLNPDEFDETLKFSGKGSAINNYLINKYLLDESLEVNYRELYMLNVKEFTLKVDSIYDIMKHNFNNFLQSNNNINEKLIELEKAKMLYDWANKKLNYSQYYKYYTKKDTVILGDDYYNYLSNIDFNDSLLLQLKEFKIFLMDYLNIKADDIYDNDQVLRDSVNGLSIAQFKAIDQNITDKAVKNYSLYQVMDNQIKYISTKDIDDLILYFENNCTNEENVLKIRKDYKKWENLGKGKPAPDFSYPDINGEIISLKNFTGKYIYIDVWATWCAPCIKELPYLEKLQEEFKNNNIVFMSVSIDNKAELWEKMVKEKNMKGIQLYAKEAWKSSIAQNYYVNSIPRFILIGKDGNIINARSSRPSGNIKEVITQLDGI